MNHELTIGSKSNFTSSRMSQLLGRANTENWSLSVRKDEVDVFAVFVLLNSHEVRIWGWDRSSKFVSLFVDVKGLFILESYSDFDFVRDVQKVVLHYFCIVILIYLYDL